MLINKKAVKQYVLERAQQTRHHKFTRVSSSYYDYIEGVLRAAIRENIKQQPSMGKTLKP